MITHVMKKGIALLIITTALTIITTGKVTNAEARSLSVMSFKDVTRDRELACLAEAIYHESRDQGTEGMIAVGKVVMNRVRAGYGKGTCEVVRQKDKGVCQFSYYCMSAKYKKIRDLDSWEKAKAIANGIYFGFYKDPTGGALFFHAKSVRPTWRKSMQKTVTIDDHIFYVKKVSHVRTR